MNENTKTVVFLATAAVVALLVWVTRPRLPDLSAESEIPDVLFDKDPLTAASLEIIEFDEENATLKQFKVAQASKGEEEDAPKEWSIPSHDNYPADAEDQLAEVATSLVRLKVLTMETDAPGDHAEYGVVDPGSKKLKPGDVGVGVSVEMRDEADDPLVSLIVGKEVPDRSELRYVRVTGKDPVYTVKLSTNKFSTKFEDWIEDDLLKLQTWDITQVEVYDYSVDFEAGRQTPRSRMTLDYDDSATDDKWKLAVNKAFQEGKWVDQVIPDDQELDTTKLNDMKSQFDDLKIVDVARKPEGLSENLKDTGQIKLDAQSSQSLANRGFYLAQVEDRYELLSSEGEINVLMKDGVRYVLRFGEVAGRGEEDAADEEKEEGAEEAEDDESDASDGEKVNRYLFVMAEFNPASIDPPELEPMPEEKEAAEGEKAEEEKSNGEAEEAETPQGEEDKSNGDGEEAEASEAVATDEEKPAEEEASEEKPADEGDAAKDADEEKKKKEEELAKERERIEKENTRKQEEYDEKIAEGKERVKELNQRFADWYYVISDEVYQKIHLSREDIVKDKEKEEEDEDKEDEDGAGAPPAEMGAGLPAFEELKKEGVEGGEE